MFYQPLQFQFFIKIDDKIVLFLARSLFLSKYGIRVYEHNSNHNVLFILLLFSAFARIVSLIRQIIK